MSRSSLPLFALALALLAGCSDDPVPAAPATCTPACRAGYVCSAGACVSACNPPCSSSQTCTMTTSGAICEGPMVVDASDDRVDATDDVASDAPAADATDDALDAAADQSSPPDVVTADVASDTAPVDVTSMDVTTDTAAPMDVSVMDSSTDVTSDVAADVSLDAVVDVAIDSGPRDTGVDAAPSDALIADASTDSTTDAGADVAPVPCGNAGQPCCQNRVCAGAAVCDPVAMRCVAYTPTMGECTSTLRCLSSEVCGGIYLCGDRPCLLCVMPGSLPLGASCTTADQCHSDFCANGICTATCLAGASGDSDCATMNPRMICGQFTSRARSDAGLGAISTFGGCVTACTRNADCATGLVCRLQRNDFYDRLDEVCASPAGALAPGAACDPNPPSSATAAMFCNNSQCVATGDHTGFCAPFCATDADCPSSSYACITYMFGRPSGASQPIRMCARR